MSPQIKDFGLFCIPYSTFQLHGYKSLGDSIWFHHHLNAEVQLNFEWQIWFSSSLRIQNVQKMCSFHSFAIFNTNLQVFENISLSFLLKEVPFTLKWYGVRDIQVVYTNLSITGPSETFNVVQFSSPKQILRPSNRGFRKRANESSVFFAVSSLKVACLLISKLVLLSSLTEIQQTMK